MANDSDDKKGGEQAAARAGSIPLPKSKRGLKGFFNELGRELKKVNWPAPKETNRLTGVVLAVCGLVVVLLGSASFVFDWVVRIVTQGRP